MLDAATTPRPARQRAADAVLGVGACIVGALFAASLANAVQTIARVNTWQEQPRMVTVGHSLKLGGCDSTHRCAAVRP